MDGPAGFSPTKRLHAACREAPLVGSDYWGMATIITDRIDAHKSSSATLISKIPQHVAMTCKALAKKDIMVMMQPHLQSPSGRDLGFCSVACCLFVVGAGSFVSCL